MKKFRLMLVALACFVGILAGQSAHAYTVYFVNAGLSWSPSDVRAFLRTQEQGDQEKNNGWPGKELTETSDKYNGKTVYKYTFEPDGWTPGVLVFNNGNSGGGNQTRDITPKDGSLYVVKGTGDNEWEEVENYANPPTPPVTTEWTIYFVNQWWENSSNLKIFIRDGADSKHNAGWPGADLQQGTDTYTIDGTKYPVYKYTFTPEGWTPAVLVFNNGSSGNENQTADLTPVSGKLYIVKGREQVTEEADPKFDGDEPPTPPTPEYRDDLYIRGAFTDWIVNSDYKLNRAEGTGVYTATFTSLPGGKIFKIGSEGMEGSDWAVAYSTGLSEMVANTTYPCPLRKGEGSDMALKSELKNVTVTFDMSGETPTVKFTADGGNVNPDGPRTLYVSFGQERILSGNRSAAPKIHFGGNTIDAATDAEMTKVYTESDSPIWSFDLSEEQYALGDAVVYFELKEGGYSSYRIGKAGNRDEYNWTKYIYYVDPVKEGDTGDDSQNKVARQSYITKDQFTVEKYADKEKLYITGQGFANDNGETLQGWAIRPGQGGVMVLKGQHGVFTTVIKSGGELASATPSSSLPDGESGDQEGAKFKMGWLRPYDWYTANCSDLTIDDNRCWATFNLGIVGIAEDHAAITDGAVTIIRGTGSELNTEVFCTPGRTIPVSRYNQSDWFIRNKYIGKTNMNGEQVEYTLVVDLEPSCNTVTLLYFNPEPELIASEVQIDHVELTAEQAKAIRERSADQALNAEKVNGAAYMRHVNVASAQGALVFNDYDKIKGTSPAGLNYDYKVNFEILSGSSAAGTYTPEAGFSGTIDLELPGIAVGESAELGARAAFEDNNSGLHFHTKYVTAEVPVQNMSQLPVPGVNVAAKSYSYGSNHTGDPKQGIPAEESWYTLGAYANLAITAPTLDNGDATDLYWYGDFKLECPASEYHGENPELANGGEIVGPGHAATTLTGAVKGEPLTGYTPWSEGEYSDANNWADCMRSATSWPVHLPEVVKVTRKYAEDATGYWDFTEEGLPTSLEISGTAYAVYPFLLEPDAQVTTRVARRRAPGTQVTIDPGKEYTLSYQPAATPFTFALTSGELTGVKDIITGAAGNESEVEYYNLQGVRMHGEPAPGIYIRRQGASVEKVIIR